jgi:hypothetical protein
VILNRWLREFFNPNDGHALMAMDAMGITPFPVDSDLKDIFKSVAILCAYDPRFEGTKVVFLFFKNYGLINHVHTIGRVSFIVECLDEFVGLLLVGGERVNSPFWVQPRRATSNQGREQKTNHDALHEFLNAFWGVNYSPNEEG